MPVPVLSRRLRPHPHPPPRSSSTEALPPLHRRLLLRIPIRPERRCIDGPHSSAECRLRGDVRRARSEYPRDSRWRVPLLHLAEEEARRGTSTSW
ncbi:hypothetical protein B0H12DRAFT_1143278 [Mycena haematopus]|nr:hypothetical protein B0H12DRAFT_1143278 [Mycena haematopus]